MTTLARVIISFGFFVLAILLTAEAVVRIYDGRVFDLPNHKLIILNNGFHLYDKAITVEFTVPVEFKEEE